MNSTTRTVLIIIAVIVLVILANLAWNERESASAPSSTTATSTAATSTSVVSVALSSSTSQGSYTIKQISTTSKAPAAPNYKAPLTFSAGISASDQAYAQSEYSAAVAAIAQSPTDFNSWIALGDARKEAGDYAGAAADWQYMSQLYPTNIVSFANLADLYTNYLDEYPQAAAAYKQAIANNPTQVYLYDDLYTLYTNQYPQPQATIVAMLQAGIKQNPGAIELQTDLTAEEAK